MDGHGCVPRSARGPSLRSITVQDNANRLARKINTVHSITTSISYIHSYTESLLLTKLLRCIYSVNDSNTLTWMYSRTGLICVILSFWRRLASGSQDPWSLHYRPKPHILNQVSWSIIPITTGDSNGGGGRGGPCPQNIVWSLDWPPLVKRWS